MLDAQVPTSDGNFYWRVVGPDGQSVAGPDFWRNSGIFTLPKDGTYVLLLEGRYYTGGTRPYTFNLQKVTDEAAAYTLGTKIDSTIAHVGQVDRYTFSLAADAFLYFDQLTYTSQLNWSLTGPRGTIESRHFQQTDSYNRGAEAVAFFAAAGDYTLVIDGSDDFTGNYAFRLLDLSTATTITPGISTSGTLSPGNETDLFKFVAPAGQEIYIDYTAARTNDGRWRVLDRDGLLVAGPINYGDDFQRMTLTKGGTYYILYEGGGAESVAKSYAFNIQLITDDAAPLTLNVETSGRIDHAGQVDRYTFTLTGDRTVYVDPMTPNGNLIWSLTGPLGTIASRQFDQTDGASFDFNSGAVYALKAGTYSFEIDGRSELVADYKFRVFDISAATTITPGTAVTGALSPVTETKLYKFNAVEGQRFFFDRQEYNGGSMVWRLVDPIGRRVFTNYFNDQDSTVLPLTGTYTLLLEGYIYEGSATQSYKFNILENTPSAPVPIAYFAGGAGTDLVVTDVTATPAGGVLQSGAELTITWRDANTGTVPTGGSWNDRVIVRSASGEILVNAVVPYDATVSGAINGGANKLRSTIVRLPDGNRGAGSLTITVTADIANTIDELNGAGDAESNNATAIAIVSALAPYPDLVAVDVAPSPAMGWLPGDTVTLNWKTRNDGTGATGAGWTEQLLVRNLNTGAVVLSTTLVYDPAAPGNGSIGAGDSRDRSHSFVWPAGLAATGRYEFIVTVDADAEILEANAGATAETNNSTRIEVTSAPDIRINDLRVASGVVQAGGLVTIEWSDANTGNASVPISWNDRVLVRRADTFETLLNTAVLYDIAAPGNSRLEAGGTKARSFTFTMPDGARGTGSIRIEVFADQNTSGTTGVIESDEGNNGALILVDSVARPYPNLVVSSITAPATGRGGETIDVGWTVTNIGSAATEIASWTDTVILSSDATIGNADDRIIGSFAHSGVLDVAGAYSETRSVTVPLSLTGDWFVAVRTDALGQVTEPDAEADNVSALDPIVLSSPAADLVVEAVVAPTAGVSGTPAEIIWRVRNTGDAATAVDSWRDRVYLSTDDIVDAGDVIIAEILHGGALAVG
ncbi:MAG: hypothetical protein FJX57_10925, partial [Alphaproteobacteria bacterium]|nr:hypothetical protein [Alphaproteobacteria bacterium]